MLGRFTQKFVKGTQKRSFAAKTIFERFEEILPAKREQVARIKKEHGNKVDH